jgi:predicted esterase YcpF (UPF0227 family)
MDPMTDTPDHDFESPAGVRPHVIEACVERLHFLYRQSGGRKVSVVGQSLGGVSARAPWRRNPT